MKNFFSGLDYGDVNVQKIVLDELKQIDLPEDMLVCVRSNKLANVGLQDYSFKVDIYQNAYDISLVENDSSLNDSFCDFDVLKSWGYLVPENIKIKPTMRKKGFGSKLVEMMEEIAKKIDIEDVRVTNCTNPDFWKHMGYKERSNPITNREMWVKRI